MTEELFRHDGYQFEFQARVASTDGELVVLDRTAFYPGGGGQVCDTGTLNDDRVAEAFYDGNGDIAHRVPGHRYAPGDRVWGSVDWERRFDLMMGHTAEHLLFGSLRREVPDLEISKIFISPESKYVIISKDVSWEDVRKALAFANAAIRENLTVTRIMMSRDDPDLADKVRIKLDRIPEGEEISVVAIGDIDYSACSGIHVMETSELGMLLVDRKVSAGKDGVAIHFKVGDAASDSAAMLAITCLEAAEAADSKPEDIVRAVSNMKRELECARVSLKGSARAFLSSVRPKDVNGTEVYSAAVFGADRTVLADAAEKIKAAGGVAVFVSSGEAVSAVIASGSAAADCRKVLTDVLGRFGGRGGGKPDFAQGGMPDPEKAEDLLRALEEEMARSLS
jgi:alanyl-tRNA synthetase